MTEKKTFKNPVVVHAYKPFEGNEYFERSDKDAYVQMEDEASEWFDRREWDMEVTFTKKLPKLEVGTRVRSKYNTAYTYEVLAQWKDMVVVVDPNDDEIEYFDYDDLVIVS